MWVSIHKPVDTVEKFLQVDDNSFVRLASLRLRYIRSLPRHIPIGISIEQQRCGYLTGAH